MLNVTETLQKLNITRGTLHMINFFHLALLLTLLSLSGCLFETSVSDKGSISGTVKNARNDEPVVGAKIITNPGTESVLSDKNGAFLISPVPNDKYDVTITHIDFLTENVQVTVLGGDNVRTSVPLEPATASFSGTIIDFKTKLPIHGVTIQSKLLPQPVITDAKGRYQFEGVRSIKYVLEIHHPGYKGETNTLLLEGGDEKVVDISLEPITGKVEGFVYDLLTKNPLAAAAITTKPAMASIKTDSAGFFRLYSVPEGNVEVAVHTTGYGVAVTNIHVKGGGLSSVEFPLRPANGVILITVSDIKSGNSLPGALAVTAPKTKKVSSKKDGTCIISPVPAGAYNVLLSAEGFASREFPVTIMGGDTVRLSGVLMPTRGSVIGMVAEADGTSPVSGVTVTTDPPTRPMTTDSAGGFAFHDLEEGKYTLIFKKDGYVTARESLIVAGGGIAKVSIELISISGNCEGIITDAKTGKIILGATVSTTPVSNSVKSDSSGMYRLRRIVAAEYGITVSCKGYVTSTKKAVIKAGKTAVCHFVLVPALGNISGQVIDAKTDLPVEKAIVTTVPPSISVSTDEQGKFIFASNPIGSYQVLAIKQGYAPATADIVVQSGEEAGATLRLKPIPDTLGSIEGRVTDAVSGLPLSDVTISSNPATQTVKTDAQGQFIMTSVPIGRYSFSFTKKDYAEAVKEIRIEGGKTASADIVLSRIVGTVRGKVTDEVTGAALSGVTIKTVPETQTAVTDAKGAFWLKSLPIGEIAISAAKSGYVFAEKSVRVMGGIQVRADISLLPSHGSLGGKIIDARTLAPLAEVALTTIPPTQSVTTRPDGTFTIEKVMSGTYILNAVKAGYSPGSLKLRVMGGKTASANLSLNLSTGAVSGNIADAKTGRAVSGASVVTVPPTAAVTSDETGLYIISGMTLRDFKVIVTADGYTELAKTISVKSGEIAKLDFSLTPNQGSISGSLSDSRTGAPLAGVSITTDPPTLSVTTDAQGHFSLGPIATGTYIVGAQLAGYVVMDKTIVVTAGETAVASFILTSKNGKITGKVTDRAGAKALAGVVLTTEPATFSVTTDANGDFSFSELPPRAYTIKAVKQGYYDAVVEVNVTAAQTSSANLQMDDVLPILSISPTVLNFSTQKTALQFRITNGAGQGVLSYDIEKPESATWMALSSLSGSVVDEADDIICTVDRAALSPGNYLADLVVSSNGGGETVQAVMIVPNPGSPQLTVSKSLLDFEKGAVELQFTISNTGTGSLDYTIADDMDWLMTSPVSGTLNAVPEVITVMADRTNLTQIKIYTGRITVSSNGGSEGIDVSLETASEPLEPVTLSYTDLTSSGCRLTWSQVTKPEDFKAYEIYESAVADFSLGEATKLATLSAYTSLSYSIAAAEHTTRYYRVYAVNKTDASTSSNEIVITFPTALRTWTYSLNSSTGGYQLADIRSLDDGNAWACGSKGEYGVILKWDNVARDWNEMPLPSNVKDVSRLHPLSSALIYAAGYGPVSGEEKALILKFSSGAWAILHTGPKASETYRQGFGDLHVFNDNLIYCSWEKHYKNVYKIESGVWNNTGIQGWNVWFPNEENGYVSGDEQYISKYNGFGWTSLPYTDAGVFGRITSASGGNIVTHKGNKVYIYENDLLGHTLDPLTDGFKCNVNSTFALDSTWLWVGGRDQYQYDDRLLHYNGVRFEKVVIAGNPGFYRFWFHSKQSGWALADNGIYLYR